MLIQQRWRREENQQFDQHFHQYAAGGSPVLVVVPGLAAATFFRREGITTYNQALPALMQHYYGKGMLGLGISAILASLMSGLAGNINALSTLWTHDIYRAHIRRSEDDKHYCGWGGFRRWRRRC